ncbi:putative C6 finger domain protein [Paecilomyces variotii]|uniref:Putative C6 finger domain protein n=1 Tax=Byssochlamys spectabilis TaxID=264951 RepID=A0A443HVG8_BYSSP|nr:putative C6 finger domain protein [Paecilomyces variotii]KAJ9202683.1 transcriptional regulator family: Fungal Specific TF [Paecilomyces variotii]KAJ9276839.1 transcriptional regulator family: Fungal Specific TF [Paecilomyces variotii]KAJ9340862.1 transcriptional regulator family: Fungal Specific TF [Paecilomyces variotii]KAJ9358434.1 transcriptional regulator family: Fungal Specific TF [Paecilomyces variotii]KAJ9380713.1 transcriptional regulator family: Fungal Specific TF [Paecilomyces va
MPGVPSNRACERCKQRHLKCDETRPGCRRCASAGIECPGYVQTRKFIDEGATVRRRYAPYHSNTPRSTTASMAAAASREKASSPKQDSRLRASDADRHVKTSAVDASQAHQNGPEKDALGSEPMAQSNNDPTADSADSGSTGALELTAPTAGDGSTSSELPSELNGTVALPHYDEGDSSVFNKKSIIGPSVGSYSAALLSPLDSLSAPFEPPASFPALQTNVEVSTQKKLGNDPSDILSELMIGGEHEMAFLSRHFCEVLGPWLDLFDAGKLFSAFVPIRSINSSMLKYAVAAAAAKHLGRVKGAKSLVGGGMFTSPATMEVYPNAPRVDWFFKAANYYHQALFYLRQSLPGSFATSQFSELAESPVQIISQWLSLNLNAMPVASDFKVNGSVTGAKVFDEILPTAAILSVYEFLDLPGPEWETYLSGLKPMVESFQTSHVALQCNAAIFSQATRAAFWVFAREDYLAAYINRTKTQLDPENLPLWRSAGIPIDEQGVLRLDNSVPRPSEHDSLLTKEDIAANGLVWLLSKLINFLAKSKESQLAQWATPSSMMSSVDEPQIATSPPAYPTTTVWLRLCFEFQTWVEGLPETFRPCVRIEQPRDMSVPSDTARLPFPEIFYSLPICAATMQHFHFARIALLLNRPPDVVSSASTARDRLQGFREVTKEVEHRCREICGIALGRPEGAVRIHMVQPLFVAGQCLENPEERQIIIDLLRGIEADFGWSTDYRIKQLQADWER